MVLQSGDDLTLIHVELEAPLYQVLDLYPPFTMTPVDAIKTAQYQDAAKEIYKGLKVTYTQMNHMQLNILLYQEEPPTVRLNYVIQIVTYRLLISRQARNLNITFRLSIILESIESNQLNIFT